MNTQDKFEFSYTLVLNDRLRHLRLERYWWEIGHSYYALVTIYLDE